MDENIIQTKMLLLFSIAIPFIIMGGLMVYWMIYLLKIQ